MSNCGFYTATAVASDTAPDAARDDTGDGNESSMAPIERRRNGKRRRWRRMRTGRVTIRTPTQEIRQLRPTVEQQRTTKQEATDVSDEDEPLKNPISESWRAKICVALGSTANYPKIAKASSHRGMLPCFFGGVETLLFSKELNVPMRRSRLSAGNNTSSTKPRAAA